MNGFGINIIARHGGGSAAAGQSSVRVKRLMPVLPAVYGIDSHSTVPRDSTLMLPPASIVTSVA